MCWNLFGTLGPLWITEMENKKHCNIEKMQRTFALHITEKIGVLVTVVLGGRLHLSYRGSSALPRSMVG
jgi:hypothetical protein